MRKVAAVVPWRVAASQAWLSGLGFGLPGVYGTAYFARHGHVWTFQGFPTYRGEPFEAIGLPTSVGLLSGFVIVCATEVVAGNLLWKRQRSGLWLSLALLPLEAAYWIGFALPFGPLLGAVRTAAVVVAFRSARVSTPKSPA
jgi:hypothetical protein